ncbi:MAG: translational GTPase TypA, partial [bacterium]|nr:translational GTPase TypA [bacterium]
MLPRETTTQVNDGTTADKSQTQVSTLRNIAIIAHVDHGKTTLVDARLKQTKTVVTDVDQKDLIMDSMDLERERGITIKAKNASLVYKGIKINIVDTPGHADFGGEVERILKMVDGVVLLVDAKEGPKPQTRFVLKKALSLGLRAIVVVNKVDRPDANPEEAVNKTFDLFAELNATNEQLEFPIVYASALKGFAGLEPDVQSGDLIPLFETIIKETPPPLVEQVEQPGLLVLALQDDSYVGRLGVGKLRSGTLKKGQSVVCVTAEVTDDQGAPGKIAQKTPGVITDIRIFEGLGMRSVKEVSAGEIVAVAGCEHVKIGDTITDPSQPRVLGPVHIDPPTVQMTFGVNTSPFAGRDGKKLTSRQIKERLERELETNVSLRVEPTDSPDRFLVSGRGDLHLSVLIETMRREGFELQVSSPRVITKKEEGKELEPYEFVSIDVPEEFQGAVIQELGARGAEMTTTQPDDQNQVHLEYIAPTRGLLGLKAALATKTRGTALLSHVFDSYREMTVKLPERSRGSLVAHEDGRSSAYGLDNAQERGELYIGPGVEIYAGMVVGSHSRTGDLVVNVCKSKKLTNMRASGTDESILLTPPREFSLEESLEE